MQGGKRENMTISRSILTNLYSFLFRLFFGKKITDATNGFRVFKSQILDDTRINLWQDWMIQYELEPYLLIKSCKYYKVAEAPVRKIYHSEMKSNTKMVPLKGWWSILRPLFIIKLGIKK
jgi:dolichol-phosphate mannosyltransferase